eukprot:Skav222223  [mRNA]  locus=scaffold552:487062:489744:+ [translate_table: standard]
MRLTHAWHRHVGQLMEDRQDFAGIGWVDPVCTLARQQNHSAEDAGLLRVALNGTFFTRDKQFHSGKFTTPKCPWCDSDDSIWHRHWECPHFVQCWGKVDPDMKKLIEQQPACTKLHGWMVETPTSQAFRSSLTTIPDTSDQFEPVSDLPDHLHAFVDGTCLEPATPTLRLAAWGVTIASKDLQDFQPIAAGGVPGLLQTILRAELWATITAVKFCLRTGKPLTIWTDSQIVFNRVDAMLSGVIRGLHNLHTNHDLWLLLETLVDRVRTLRIPLYMAKVVSHVDESCYPLEVDKWVIRGNHAADRLAAAALRTLPSGVLQLWEQQRREYRERTKVRDAIHMLFLEVGRIAVASKSTQRIEADDAWDAPPASGPPGQGEVTFLPWNHEPAQSMLDTFGDRGRLFHRWVARLTQSPGAKPAWLSGYQLLVHFQCTMKHLGFMYLPKVKQWVDLAERTGLEEFDFLRATQWFVAFLKSWTERSGMTYYTASRVPAHLESFSHVVLDEVHERFVEADFLMALLRILLSRPSTMTTRIVVMLGGQLRRGVAGYSDPWDPKDVSHAAASLARLLPTGAATIAPPGSVDQHLVPGNYAVPGGGHYWGAWCLGGPLGWEE